MIRTRSACPECGDRKPKEVLESKKHDTATWLLFTVLSCGLGLLAYSCFYRKTYEAYCERCRSTHDVR